MEELSLDQQALLVGMVKGASVYNPWRNPKLALERRNLVLRLLQQQQVIDQELYDMLSARPLGVQPRGGVISPQPAFMQMVRQELQAKLGDKVKDLSGVKIFTTFDSVAQDAAEKAATEGIPVLKKQRKLADLETAMVVVDRFTGEVRAMVGGAEPQFAGYNRAMQARRSIGSLAKPATYLTALSQPNQYRLNTWIADAPVTIRLSNGQTWSPQNDDRRFSGQVMLVDALTRSMNVPTVNLGMALGLPAVVDTWTKLGAPKNQLNAVPAMLLGALNLTPIEVAQAFQTIASGGNRAPLSALRSVIAEDGTVLYQSYPQAERAVPAQAAYMTLWTMQQVVQRGTGRQLGAKYPGLHLAGKTGTTNNNVDTWFAGIDGSGDHHLGGPRQQPADQTVRRQRRDVDLPALSGEPDADAAGVDGAGRRGRHGRGQQRQPRLQRWRPFAAGLDDAAGCAVPPGRDDAAAAVAAAGSEQPV